MNSKIEELADIEAKEYTCDIQLTEDRSTEHSDIDYTNGFIAGYQKATEA